MPSADVLVVGAGPAGLVAATVLAARGVAVRIIDRGAGPVEQSRAAIVHVRTLESLDRLGIADRAVARGVPTTRVEIVERGRPVGGFPLAGRGAEADTAFPFALGLEQDRTELLLLERLGELGAHVEWGTELTGLDDQRVTLRRGADGEEVLAPRWVVAADGARSTVRHALGVPFTGSTYDQTGLLADVRFDRPDVLTPRDGIRLYLTSGGIAGALRLSGGHHRIFGALPAGLLPNGPREVSHEPYAEVDDALLRRWFDRLFALPAAIDEVRWTALFRVHSRIAARFRVGRVFLIGDAAHIHSPAGGQGMNLAVGDALDLAWKLAAVARDEARPDLLDTFETERRSVARSVLRWTDRGFALETTSNPAARWARAHVAGRVIGPLTRLPAVRSAVYRLFAQTWISYRDSPAVAGRPPDRRGPHPGDRLPFDPALPTAATRPGDLRHHLVLLGAAPSEVESVLGRYRLDVGVHPAATRGQPWLLLVRPDGHVGWTGPADDGAGLEGYLNRWYVRRAD